MLGHHNISLSSSPPGRLFFFEFQSEEYTLKLQATFYFPSNVRSFWVIFEIRVPSKPSIVVSFLKPSYNEPNFAFNCFKNKSCTKLVWKTNNALIPLHQRIAAMRQTLCCDTALPFNAQKEKTISITYLHIYLSIYLSIY